MSEPQFFVNDFLVESQKEIEDVLKTLKTTEPKYQDRAYFMKKFTNLMFRSYIKNKNSWKEEEHNKIKHETELELLEIEREKIAIEHLLEETEEKKKEKMMKKEELKKELERKREEILKKLHPELQRTPIQKPEEKKAVFEEMPMPLPHNLKGNTPKPIHDEHEALAPSAISEEHEEGAPLNIIRKDLVVSSETKKVLAYSEFDSNEYKIIEPELNEKDSVLIQNIKAKLDTAKIEDRNYLYPLIQNEAKAYQTEFNDDCYDKIRYYLLRDIKDMGIISPLLKDPNISEIVCDSPNTPLHIVYDGKHDILTNIQFANDEELNNYIISLAKKTNQLVNNENPFLIGETEKYSIQATLGTPNTKPRLVIEKK